MTSQWRGRVLVLAAGVGLTAVLGGCGGSDDSVGVTDPGASTGASPSSSPTSGATDLKIETTDGGRTTTWTLTCPDTGTASGTHPTPDKACTVLAKHGAAALPPVAPDKVCSMIYGGSQTATVTGTWKGTPVSSSFKRTNGCEIARWNQLAGLLPDLPTGRMDPGPQ